MGYFPDLPWDIESRRSGAEPATRRGNEESVIGAEGGAGAVAGRYPVPMELEPVTLSVTSALISVIMGTLLMFAWVADRQTRSLLLWGFGFCALGIGISLIGKHGAEPYAPPAPIAAGNVLVLAGLGLHYVGCRLFNGRPMRLHLALAGMIAWVAVWTLAPEKVSTGVGAPSVIIGMVLIALGLELRCRSSDRLVAQCAARCLCLVIAVVYILRGTVGQAFAHQWPDFLSMHWSFAHAMMMFFFVPSFAVLLLSMSREQAERALRKAATTDPLTGISNRRAFLAAAEKALARPGAKVGCLLFDLDRFKNINDTYGHPFGDQVLIAFARTLERVIPGCPFGRLGGEEFAAMVIGDEHQVAAAAERIRAAFKEVRHDANGTEVQTTVSIGYTTAPKSSLTEMMLLADKALYRAKASGRDRVVGHDTFA